VLISFNQKNVSDIIKSLNQYHALWNKYVAGKFEVNDKKIYFFI